MEHLHQARLHVQDPGAAGDPVGHRPGVVLKRAHGPHRVAVSHQQDPWSAEAPPQMGHTVDHDHLRPGPQQPGPQGADHLGAARHRRVVRREGLAEYEVLQIGQHRRQHERGPAGHRSCPISTPFRANTLPPRISRFVGVRRCLSPSKHRWFSGTGRPGQATDVASARDPGHDLLWSTRCLDASVTALREVGVEVNDEDAARLSPLRARHLNILGRYSFRASTPAAGGGFRPLRTGHGVGAAVRRGADGPAGRGGRARRVTGRSSREVPGPLQAPPPGACERPSTAQPTLRTGRCRCVR